MTILFIGLGVMGAPMAGHLTKLSETVIAYNRSAQKALDWKESHPNAKIATDLTLTKNKPFDSNAFDYSSLSEPISQSNVIISCVGNDQDLKELAFSDQGILKNAKEETIWIEHSTSSANVAREIYTQLQHKSIHFLDAPVSGGEQGAINGALTVMVGGDEEPLLKVKSILKSYAKQITHIGESGSGQLTKMVNQICLAGVLQGLSEGLTFAKKTGLDCHKVIQAISQGAAQSWQMDNRANTMVADEFDFGFAIEWMKKDLNICLEEALERKVNLPMTKFIQNQYEKLIEKGFARSDTSVLIKQFGESSL